MSAFKMKLMTKAHSKKPAAAVRIIGGTWKRSVLAVTPAPDLRPTPNRLRETLFNWLGQDLSGWHCADVFAGSGALGFEAASRGAERVWMNETHPQAFAQLVRNAQKLNALQISLSSGDGLSTLAALPPRSLDVVFLDPPFSATCHAQALRLSQQQIKHQGWVYLEAGQAWTSSQFEAHGLALHRHAHAGQVHAHLAHPIA